MAKVNKTAVGKLINEIPNSFWIEVFILMAQSKSIVYSSTGES